VISQIRGGRGNMFPSKITEFIVQLFKRKKEREKGFPEGYS